MGLSLNAALNINQIPDKSIYRELNTIDMISMSSKILVVTARP